MNPSERLVTLLETLAAKFGTTVEHLWPQLVARTRLIYIATTVSVFVAWIVVVWFTRALNKGFNTACKKDHDHGYAGCRDAAGTKLIIAIIVLAGFSIGLMVQISNIADLIYPEAATIQYLLDRSH